jgi:hypothetical protein
VGLGSTTSYMNVRYKGIGIFHVDEDGG